MTKVVKIDSPLITDDWLEPYKELGKIDNDMDDKHLADIVEKIKGHRIRQNRDRDWEQEQRDREDMHALANQWPDPGKNAIGDLFTLKIAEILTKGFPGFMFFVSKIASNEGFRLISIDAVESAAIPPRKRNWRVKVPSAEIGDQDKLAYDIILKVSTDMAEQIEQRRQMERTTPMNDGEFF